MEAVQVIKSIFCLQTYGAQFEVETTQEMLRTSITSSNTTKAVPFVFCSFPIRIWRMLP